MKIDIFNHVFPKPLFERLERHLPAVLYQRYQAIATIHDPDARLRMLDEFDDVQQVLSLSQPPLEETAWRTGAAPIPTASPASSRRCR